jgi:hypothetical protein
MEAHRATVVAYVLGDVEVSFKPTAFGSCLITSTLNLCHGQALIAVLYVSGPQAAGVDVCARCMYVTRALTGVMHIRLSSPSMG